MPTAKLEIRPVGVDAEAHYNQRLGGIWSVSQSITGAFYR